MWRSIVANDESRYKLDFRQAVAIISKSDLLSSITSSHKQVIKIFLTSGQYGKRQCITKACPRSPNRCIIIFWIISLSETKEVSIWSNTNMRSSLEASVWSMVLWCCISMVLVIAIEVIHDDITYSNHISSSMRSITNLRLLIFLVPHRVAMMIIISLVSVDSKNLLEDSRQSIMVAMILSPIIYFIRWWNGEIHSLTECDIISIVQ